MIRAVIFDVDGVLADSLNANTHFFQSILSSAGYKHPTRKDIAKIFHLSRLDTIKFLTGADSEREIKRIMRVADRIKYPVKLLKANPGASLAVRKLSRLYVLGIVTSRIRKTTESYFKFSGLKKYFTAVVTYEDSKNHKPHPEPLFTAAKKLKVSPGEAVYIGDAQTDLMASKAAGMKVIIYGRKKIKGADYVANSFKKIPQLVSRL